MHTHFPVSVIQLASRKGIVKVLGIFRVDGKGQDLTEILTLGNFFFRDNFRYLICRLFHIFRISIRQAEFCQYRMHFGCILTGHTQNIDHFTQRVLGFVRPFNDTDNGFIAILAAFQFFFRDKYIVCQRLVLGDEEGKAFRYLQFADKCLFLAFQYFDHFGFRFSALAFGKQLHLHFITVHRMSGIPFRHENRRTPIFRYKRVFPVAPASECTDRSGTQTVIPITSAVYFCNKIFGREIIQQVYNL